MIEIVIKSKTEKGKNALTEHCKSTRIRDKLYMKSLGVTQTLADNILIIEIDNLGIRILEKQAPWKLKEYFKEDITKLTSDIDKLNVKKDIDYTIEVDYNARR